jgi:hypothetical protein
MTITTGYTNDLTDPSLATTHIAGVTTEEVIGRPAAESARPNTVSVTC